MPERPTPDIPKHLRDSLPSAGAYEQGVRRDYQIQDLRYSLRIPKESFSQYLTVRSLVTTLRDTGAQVDRLRWPDVNPVVERSSVTGERLTEARALYDVSRAILGHGFPATSWWGVPDVFRKKLDRLAYKRGYQVESDTSAERLVSMPSGLWVRQRYEDAPEEPWKRPNEPTRWYWPDMPNERHDPEHLAALHTEANRQGVPGDFVSFDPATHLLLTSMVYGRELVAHEERFQSLPEVPGLSPSAKERLAQAGVMNRLGLASLESVANPDLLTDEQFAAELEHITSPSGLVIRPLPELEE